MAGSPLLFFAFSAKAHLHNYVSALKIQYIILYYVNLCTIATTSRLFENITRISSLRAYSRNGDPSPCIQAGEKRCQFPFFASSSPLHPSSSRSIHIADRPPIERHLFFYFLRRLFCFPAHLLNLTLCTASPIPPSYRRPLPRRRSAHFTLSRRTPLPLLSARAPRLNSRTSPRRRRRPFQTRHWFPFLAADGDDSRGKQGLAL